MDRFYEISNTIQDLRKRMEGFSECIDSAIERSGITPELSVRQFFFKTGESIMPSRLYKGRGTLTVFVIDDIGVVMKMALDGGGSFIAHTHNDAAEIILVTKGIIREIVSNTTLKVGERFRVESGQLHEYEIIEDSVIITTFIFTQNI